VNETQTEIETELEEGERHARRRPGIVGVFAEAGEPLAVTVVTRPLVLGRAGGGADVEVDDGKVSRRHLELGPAVGGLRVRDLGSRNGSELGPGALSDIPEHAPWGSLIRIGRQVLLVTDDVEVHAHRHLPVASRMKGGPSLAGTRKAIRQLAPTEMTVLVVGESGTGKELVAETLHEVSGRAGPLVRVNAAAIPAELVESELFGHLRGAFSGSDQARKGLFREADGGTLVLDEIGELQPGIQAKLLRVLEDKRVRPVGADRDLEVDVRVVGSTNRDLELAARDGRFRLDLYHRLAQAVVTLPPLRDRLDDVPALAAGFAVAEGVNLSARAALRLALHDWPGNVRQLRHTVTRAAMVALAEGRDRIDVPDVPALSTRLPGKADGGAAEIAAARDDDVALRSRITTALEMCDGNVSRVSRELGIARSQLYVLLQRLAIDPTQFRSEAG